MIREALICAAAVVGIDVARAYGGVLVPALSVWIPLAFLPVVTYVAIGFVQSRRGADGGTALSVVAAAAVADVLVGTPLSRLIDPGAMPAFEPHKYLIPLAVTVAVNTALGAGGIWLGSLGREMPA